MSQLNERILELIVTRIETDETYRRRLLNALLSSGEGSQEKMRDMVKSAGSLKKTISIATSPEDEELFGDLDLPPLDLDEFE
ncbi:MAG: hypothetical protein ACXAB7_02090 [Candidatus Kariarchaeaceae archaeon]|jgi:hypothetical protein